MKYESNDKNVTFTRSCIPNYHFSFNHSKNCIKDNANRQLQKHLMTKNTPYYIITKEIKKYSSVS